MLSAQIPMLGAYTSGTLTSRPGVATPPLAERWLRRTMSGMRSARPLESWPAGFVVFAAALLALVGAAPLASRSIDPTPAAAPSPEAQMQPRAVMPALTRDVHGWSNGRAEIPASVRFGESVEGRPLLAYRLGDGPLRVVLVSGLHAGSELEAVTLGWDLFDHYAADPRRLPPEVTLYFVPSPNPDGHVAHERTNANGVDLNRNWPSENWSSEAVHGFEPVSAGPAPLSEPETRALYGFLQEYDPHLVISWHTFAGVVEGNDLGTAEALAAVYAGVGDLELIAKWELYEITGDLLAATREEGIPAFDVELVAGDSDPFLRHIDALNATLVGLVARHRVVVALLRDGFTGRSAVSN